MNLPVRLDEDGAAAPPRENGELAFSAPWESRLFGLTMVLVEAGRLDWEAFRGRLIVRIAAWEKRASWPPSAAAGGNPGGAAPRHPRHSPSARLRAVGCHAGAPSAGESWNYWQCWQEALEDSLEAAGLVAAPEIDRLTGQLAARPHGHDHRHDRDHHHEHSMENDE